MFATGQLSIALRDDADHHDLLGIMANMMKLTPVGRFPLSIGIMWREFCSSACVGAHHGSTGALNAMLANLGRAGGTNIMYALAVDGVNVANLLLVAAISIAGLAVGVSGWASARADRGCSLELRDAPAANPVLLFAGVALSWPRSSWMPWPIGARR